MFSGSYQKGEVQFLLKIIEMDSTSVEQKERNIQKEKAHYSEMITYEKSPSPQYMKIFHEALSSNKNKFATDMYNLSKKITEDYNMSEIVVVSLARAGTPIGVIIKKMIEKHFNRHVQHYCISIIRDRGVDENALNYILSKHQDKQIVFVDGWTGKGVIGEQLKQSVDDYNKIHHTNISSNLYVVADISGTAYWAATYQDYLLPSAILNSTISGLISRTILNKSYISKTDFHGCLFYKDLKDSDISSWFVNEIMNCDINFNFKENIKNKEEINKKSRDSIAHFMKEYALSNRNFIKPGVGESTRVLLRRVPKIILIKNKNDPSVQHLLYLAKEKSIEIKEIENLNYNAIAIIEEID